VNLIVRTWRSPVLRVSLLALAIAAAPLPVLAGDATTGETPPVPTIKTSVENILATQTLAPPATTARAQQTGGTTDLGSRTFFRTPAGIAALVALAAGTAYALYSTTNDRVKSPAR
jgi:hypothetical protein